MIIFFGIIQSMIPALCKNSYDLTLVAQVNYYDGLGRLALNLTNLLKDDLSINFIASGPTDFTEVPLNVQTIMQNPDKTPGNVALLFDILWYPKRTPTNCVPKESLIKIAYSMSESTAISPKWVELLNGTFDLVVVPDEYYRSVFSNCGVLIPIFVLPHGIDIENFLSTPLTKKPSNPFVFGSTGTFMSRKNHELLIEAFYAEFGNDPHVKLKVHGRRNWFGEFDIESLREKLHITKSTLAKDKSKRANKKNKKNILKTGRSWLTNNIELILTSLESKQYESFFNSLDCYVLLSKGEGFSITPREALALGIPTIISDNTAHRTIAKTGFVYAVPSNIQEPAYYSLFKDNHGVQFNCSVADARKALREVYNNYQVYREKALGGRKWVEQYLWRNLKAQFLNLIKPKEVILGEENKVTNEYIMTSSEKLYKKYVQIETRTQIL